MTPPTEPLAALSCVHGFSRHDTCDLKALAGGSVRRVDSQDSLLFRGVGAGIRPLCLIISFSWASAFPASATSLVEIRLHFFAFFIFASLLISTLVGSRCFLKWVLKSL